MSIISFGILLLLPLMVLVHFRRGEKKLAVALLWALIAGLLASLLFQYLALRPRPQDVRLLWPSPDFPSFPSGHATVTFAAAMLYVLVGRQPRRWLLLAVMVAMSRVYLGHHYPTDVLGGTYLGLSIGAACYGIFLEGHPEETGLALVAVAAGCHCFSGYANGLYELFTLGFNSLAICRQDNALPFVWRGCFLA